MQTIQRNISRTHQHYQFDWSLLSNDGARFENLVACHLLKWVHHQQDTQDRDVELRYFRDTDSREVDFVITERNKPITLVECKWSGADVDRGIRYLHGKHPHADTWQVSAIGCKDYVTPDGIRVAPAMQLLPTLV